MAKDCEHLRNEGLTHDYVEEGNYVADHKMKERKHLRQLLKHLSVLQRIVVLVCGVCVGSFMLLLPKGKFLKVVVLALQPSWDIPNYIF